MPQPTHVNAYKVELEEAKADEARAHSKVETLRETIATMEQADASPAEEVAEVTPEPIEEPETPEKTEEPQEDSSENSTEEPQAPDSDN